MAVLKQHGFEVYRIEAADGSATADIVPELGAAMSSLRLPGRRGLQEFLFTQPFFWERQPPRTRGGLPFLFPVCGRLERDGEAETYLYDGRRYRLPIHGFAMRLPWEVRRADATSLTLALRDSADTQARYPFAFELGLTFRLVPGKLLIEQDYRNRGEVALPYYAGFHPYYRIPDGTAKDAMRLNYRPTARLLYNDRLTDVVGREPAPALPTAVTDPALHEALTEVDAARDVELIYPDGTILHTDAVGVEHPDLFPYVQLYTAAEQPFFCVEPWMGFPNALNTVKGCRWLAPRQAERGVLSVWTTQLD